MRLPEVSLEAAGAERSTAAWQPWLGCCAGGVGGLGSGDGYWEGDGGGLGSGDGYSDTDAGVLGSGGRRCGGEGGGLASGDRSWDEAAEGLGSRDEHRWREGGELASGDRQRREEGGGLRLGDRVGLFLTAFNAEVLLAVGARCWKRGSCGRLWSRVVYRSEDKPEHRVYS